MRLPIYKKVLSYAKFICGINIWKERAHSHSSTGDNVNTTFCLNMNMHLYQYKDPTIKI